jgi:hypothetical protein
LNIFIPIINETFRLLVFLIIVWIATALHESLIRQKELARDDQYWGGHFFISSRQQ